MDNTELKTLVNLGTEVRSGYEVTSEVKRLWNVQLLLLSKLVDVCKKYDLKVFATGGTLIGAVRDHGFIPWDDDIDVVMLRPDYDKLVDVSSKEFNSPFFFQCAYTESGYFRGHAQLRYDHTTGAIPYDLDKKRKFHQGIFIDVFVMDGVPESLNERNYLAKLQRNILNFLWMRYNPEEREWFDYIKCYLKLGVKAFWTDLKLYGYLEDQFRKYRVEDSRLVGPVLFKPLRESSYYDKEWYDAVEYVPFENIEMPIPREYDVLLQRRYGDYMKPQQIPTLHGELIWSVDKDYKEYLK